MPLTSASATDRLFLSVRTVNNHLYDLDSKLGVVGRRQLAVAIAELDPASAGWV